MELEFARAQVEAGADLIGVGDAAASLVGPQIYEEFVRPYEQRLVDGLHAMGTRCGCTSAATSAASCRASAAWAATWSISTRWSRWSKPGGRWAPKAVLAGNLDPVKTLRNGTPEAITAAIAECHRQAGPRYIVAAGCEVPRDTPEANVLALTEYARSHGA